jgi:hypothetical protein
VKRQFLTLSRGDHLNEPGTSISPAGANERPKKAAKAPPLSGQSGGKTSGITSGGTPVLIPQGHGGALLAGGHPGHRGAGGRPTGEIRQIARLAYEERIPILCQIADGMLTRSRATAEGPMEEGPSFKDRIQAIAELAKVGIGTKVEMDTPPSPFQVCVTVGPEVAAEVQARDQVSQGIWNP